MSLRLARRCHFPAPTSARTSSFSSVSRGKRIAPRHSVRRSQWKSSCVGSSNSALSVIGDCSSTSSPNEACLGCFEELSLSYELHNFRDTTLTFGLNVTLDGCCDHREGIADDELHDYFTQ